MKLWADHESELDLIGFRHLADAVVAIVKSDDLLPATIGVFGDWGSGKSTLLNMVAETLVADKDTLVLKFNGWLFEGYDDAKAALMETIIDAIVAREGVGSKAKKFALQLIRRVNWFRVAGKAIKYGTAFAVAGPPGVGVVAGLDAMEVAKKAGETLEGVSDEQVDEMFKGESSAVLLQGVRKFREDFESLLEASSIKKLVVIAY
jgi:predicted KAP-like P-loop ATPase